MNTQLKNKMRKIFPSLIREGGYWQNNVELWDFIHSALESERKQMEKEIRGMKRKPNSNYATNAIPYNQALQDVLDLLKKETKKK